MTFIEALDQITYLEKQLRIALMKISYCERHHNFCPDCRDKTDSEKECWRCKVQRLENKKAEVK